MTGVVDNRALYFLGRRVERLFLTGIILVVLCFLEAYLTTANRELSNDQSASVIAALLGRLRSEEPKLTVLFGAKLETPVPRESSSHASSARHQRVKS